MSAPSQRRMLIVSLNFAPELTGIGKFVGDKTQWLANAGNDVRVITTPPYYPGWRVHAGYSAFRYAMEHLSGARVYRCPSLVPRRTDGPSRIAHLLSFALSSLPVLLWQALTWRPHLVFVVEPPLVCAPGVWLSSRLCGARTWLHVQDFEVDAAFELGLLKSQGLRAGASRLERALMRRFDRVSSISHRMLDRLRDKGVGESRIRLLPNWVDTTQIRPLTGEIALRTELGLPPDRPVLLYSGNMGVKQGLELLVAVAREFAGDAAPLFVFCGDGAVRAGIEAAARDLPNVRFLPLQPLERLNELLNLASVHLLPQRADAEDLVMPSKLTAIMASGRPVIAAARTGTELARVAAEGGLVVQPGSAPDFAAAIRRLLSDAPLRERFGHSGRAYALAHWSRDAVLERMHAEFDSALHKSDTSAG